MNAIRQKMRPKHQLLILKCYPKLPKATNNTNNNTAPEELKPNGSELSYLLYYASARRAKLTKVGAFLDKKTQSDVYKGRVPAVNVTLQILEAFLRSSEACGGKDGFGLFAPFVLNILKEVLTKGGSVELVEGAGRVWSAFCLHDDHATLAGDAEYRTSFASVVKIWVELASKKPGAAKKSLGKAHGLSVSDEIRLRKAGLEAMTAMSKSGALDSDPTRQLDNVLTVVLQNLWADDASYLTHLQSAEKEQAREKAAAINRGRPSMATVRTNRTTEENDARAAEGTTADADKIAEGEAGLLALHCLRGIYQVDNRSQIRAATSSLLAFVARQARGSRQSANSGAAPYGSSWATALVKMVCNWTPVQDRFVVLFTAVETLIRTPIIEEELDKQLVLSHIIGQVLASDINLIGLSIMDILLGLVQHVLLILQIGTTQATLNRGELTSSDDSFKSSGEKSRSAVEVAKTPSPSRLQLLAQLRQCIASLATHVYYTDQISDMAAAILLRLKPSPSSATNPSITAAAIEDPTAAVAEVATNASLRERPNTDGFFSFDTAREVALDAVKDIMVVANSAQLDGTSTSSNRNPVPISVWEGTQWLLRDSSYDVRISYVNALCVWLDLETGKSDVQLEDKSAPSKYKREAGQGEMARRAVSNASGRNRTTKRGRSTFLQLLHLAVYEEALQRAGTPGSDAEYLVLHLLLTTLVERLGINAVRTGLPMMLRLQEDIQLVPSPQAKIHLGSLVHGYLQTLVSFFGIVPTVPGAEITAEISRRRQHGIWLEGIQYPALTVSEIPSAVVSSRAGAARAAASNENLKPFDHRQVLVEALTGAYATSLSSESPPISPSRSFSLPMLSDSSYLNPDSTATASSPSEKVPQAVTDDLNASWSKDSLLAALASAAPKSISLSGSRTGGFASAHHHGSRTEMLRGGVNDHRHLLAAANTFPMTKSSEGSPTRNGSAGQSIKGSLQGSVRRGGPGAVSQRKQHRVPSRSPTAIGTGAAGVRRASASTQGRGNSNGYNAGLRGPSSTRSDSNVGNGGSRIEELKRALATGSTPVPNIGVLGRIGGDDDESFSDDDDDVEVEEGDYESSYGEGGDTDMEAGRGYAMPSNAAHSTFTGASGTGTPATAAANTTGTIGECTSTGFDSQTTPRALLSQGARFSSSGGNVLSLSQSHGHGDDEDLPSWSAAAMAELNAQGGGITVLHDGVDPSTAPAAAPAPSTLSPPQVHPAPLSPVSEDRPLTAPSTNINAANGRGTVPAAAASRPTTSATSTPASRRPGRKASFVSFGTSGAGGSGKRDLSGLLDSIGIGEEGEGEDGRVAPPY